MAWGLSLRIIDPTTVNEPGATGSSWRIHYIHSGVEQPGGGAMARCVADSKSSVLNVPSKWSA
jgi:hypothetical protein